MATKALEIHPSALADLKSPVTWYLQHSETAVKKFVSEVDRAVGLVIEAPLRWPTAEHGTQKFILNRFPFAVVYREKPNAIQILAFAHGHRNPEYWKDGL